MKNPGFLGQVPIQPGSGFGNTPIYWPGGFGVPQTPAAPPLARAVSQCYQLPDGSFRSMTPEQAQAMRMSGTMVMAVDSANCSRPGGLVGPSSVIVETRVPTTYMVSRFV